MSLTEADITRVVTAFYARVRSDPLLAPIFATKIKTEDWPKHIAHITDFWSSVLLKTGRFDGNPMRKHMEINGLTPAHFRQWLRLFKETADEVLLPPQSKVICVMANRIGESLQMGLAVHHAKTSPSDNPFASYSLKPHK